MFSILIATAPPDDPDELGAGVLAELGVELGAELEELDLLELPQPATASTSANRAVTMNVRGLFISA
jgi:hypothetical protein